MDIKLVKSASPLGVDASSSLLEHTTTAGTEEAIHDTLGLTGLERGGVVKGRRCTAGLLAKLS